MSHECDPPKHMPTHSVILCNNSLDPRPSAERESGMSVGVVGKNQSLVAVLQKGEVLDV